MLGSINLSDKRTIGLYSISVLPYSDRMARRDQETGETDKKGQHFAPVVSCISVVYGLLRLVLEEGFMGAPAFSIIRLFVGYLDPAMAIWIVVVMIAGFWLKRSKLPSWMPPLPVILLFCYLVISTFFGYMQYEVSSWMGVARVLLYGIGNGVVFTGVSFIFYDIAHSAIKRAKAKKAREEEAA